MVRFGRAPLHWVGGRFHRGSEKLTDHLGGQARRRVIVLLACVLALDSADKGAVGALAPQLEAAFHIGNTQIGLLVTVSSLVGALATLPLGVLADRARRTRILVIGIFVWGVAEVVSGFSVSYLMLLVSRLALGAITATAGPTVASLIGDLFSARERSRIYSFILTGELVGTGIGVLVAGDLGAAFDWRVGFIALGIPSVALAWAIWRWFPEPARGGQSRLVEGGERILSAEEVEAHPQAHPQVHRRPGDDEAEEVRDDNEVLEKIKDKGVEAAPSIVLHGDPTKLGLWQALRWVLSVRTNIYLIVASCLGYFFFAGLRTFAVIFVRGQYHLSESTATLVELVIGVAAIAGVLVSARTTDKLIHRGRIDARLRVGAAGYIAAAIIFLPGVISSNLIISLPLFVLTGFALSAPNPAVDAARLDVVPSLMWGRAEAIRTTLRTVLEAIAPLLFGFVSQVLAGGQGAGAGLGSGVNSNHAHVSAAATQGLHYTFMIMLVPLAVSGMLLLRGRRSYPTDVASASVSEENTRAAIDAGEAP